MIDTGPCTGDGVERTALRAYGSCAEFHRHVARPRSMQAVAAENTPACLAHSTAPGLEAPMAFVAVYRDMRRPEEMKSQHSLF